MLSIEDNTGCNLLKIAIVIIMCRHNNAEVLSTADSTDIIIRGIAKQKGYLLKRAMILLWHEW